MTGWYPEAVRNAAPTDGGSHLAPVTKGVLHTTESYAFSPRADSYYGHLSYPHFTVGMKGGQFVVWQHIPLTRAARALKNLAGGVDTNRAGVVQIEVLGKASEPNWPPLLKAGVARLMRWIEENTKVPARAGLTFLPYPESYGASKVRLTGHQWVAYSGWLGHQHVPENSHGDPGAIDIQALLAKDDLVSAEDNIKQHVTGAVDYAIQALKAEIAGKKCECVCNCEGAAAAEVVKVIGQKLAQ